jgi:hypothetical protein
MLPLQFLRRDVLLVLAILLSSSTLNTSYATALVAGDPSVQDAFLSDVALATDSPPYMPSTEYAKLLYERRRRLENGGNDDAQYAYQQQQQQNNYNQGNDDAANYADDAAVDDAAAGDDDKTSNAYYQYPDDDDYNGNKQQKQNYDDDTATFDDDIVKGDNVKCSRFLVKFLEGTTDARDTCEGIQNAYTAAGTWEKHASLYVELYSNYLLTLPYATPPPQVAHALITAK